MAAAKAFWWNMKAKPSVVPRKKNGIEPGVECLCFKPDYFYRMFKVHA